MSCMPISGGNERSIMDPFVRYLNREESRQYQLESLPDQLDKTSKQPEAIYRDSFSEKCLVIECKTFIWPMDYAARHRNDHEIAHQLFHELGALVGDHPLTISLPRSTLRPRAELMSYAKDVADSVRSVWNDLLAGERIEFDDQGRNVICFLDDRDEEDPLGLAVSWKKDFGWTSLDPLPSDLKKELVRLLDGADAKFSGYAGARTVLMLDVLAGLPSLGAGLWAKIWEQIPVPHNINEVWTWIEEEENMWFYERLFPVSGTNSYPFSSDPNEL